MCREFHIILSCEWIPVSDTGVKNFWRDYYFFVAVAAAEACAVLCLAAQLCLTVTPQTAACQASLSFTVSRSWLRLIPTGSVKLPNRLILCPPLLLLPLLFPSIRVFWAKSVILEPRKIKSVTVSTFPPSICHEVMGLDAMILVFNVES